jgi:hypothetical protein
MTLVAGVAYRWVRMFDLRESPSSPAISCNSRCVHSLSLDLDSNYFGGYSDEGVVTVWDRRFARTNLVGEPALLFNRVMDDSGRSSGQITHLRYSNSREGTFAVLNASGGLRLYEMNKVSNQDPLTTASIGIGSGDGIMESHKPRGGGWRDSAASLLEAGRGAYGGGGTSTSGTRTPNIRFEGETLLVSRVNDLATSDRIGKIDKRIACFDWISEGPRPGGPHSGRLKILALRGDGSLEVMQCPGSTPSIAWGSRNEFTVSCDNNLTVMPAPSTKPSRARKSRRKSSFDDGEERDEKYQYAGSIPGQRLGMLEKQRVERSNSIVKPEDFLPGPAEALQRDICVIMRKRVEAGYLMDCAKNAELAKQAAEQEDENPYLEDMWIWLDGAQESANDGGMMTSSLDLSFTGVNTIWHGGKDTTPASRIYMNKQPHLEDWAAACAEINKKLSRRRFDSCETAYPEQRRLCLAICGYNFDPEELEEKISIFESSGEYTKAAGLALFHGKIARCIRSLQHGGQTLKLMSTAVAGYFATARDPSSSSNSTWKDLASEMATELDDPYQRAIFAYIANSEWKDVLYDIGLPIRERIGIALRWLDDEDLTNFLEGVTKTAVSSGDLEGIILTGVSEESTRLLQEYINRTGDVQTAALVSAFASPRHFKDERVEYWTESYRQLLNSWHLFHARAKFDVARGQASKDRSGVMTLSPPQRQVYVRCANCDRSVSQYTAAPRGAAGGANVKKDPKTMTLREKQVASSSLGGGGAAVKPTVCPHCKKSLPRCAVCLLNLGTVYYGNEERSADAEKDYDMW